MKYFILYLVNKKLLLISLLLSMIATQVCFGGGFVAQKERPSHKHKIKHVKLIDKSLLKDFKHVQQVIKNKTKFEIKSEANIKLDGYFAVYVLSDYQYIALRDLKNGFIAIDFYETKDKSWTTLAQATYAELLLFKTSRTGAYIDVYLE